MKPIIFCKNCHRKLSIPKFLLSGNLNVTGAINIECGVCKCKNKYVSEKKGEIKTEEVSG